MAWRQIRYLLDSEVQASDDATKILKLPLSNVVHTLYPTIECTVGATGGKNLSIDDVVERIEVIANGSQVIVSLTPQELKRWGLLDLEVPPTQKIDERGGAVMSSTYPILFGDTEWDENKWLPCGKFTDLELRIKFSPTIAATAWTSGTVTITVLALMSMAGPPGPYQGTYRKTTIFDFTTVASGDKVIDLPKRLKYRRALLYCYEAGVEDGLNLTQVKFTLNNDERIPLDMSWFDLQDWTRKLYSVSPEVVMDLFRANADVVNTHLARLTAIELTPAQDNVSTLVSAIAGDAVTIGVIHQGVQAVNEGGTATYNIQEKVTTNTHLKLLAKGLGLPYFTVIPFDYLNGGNLFDPTQFDMVQLQLTQGNAGGDAKISLEELIML